MDTKNNIKTYFIELYNQDKLLNKFKFPIDAKKVAHLRTLIQEKLKAKGAIAENDKITIKDNDDFQVASDDEVDTVLNDGKIKAYLNQTNINVSQTNVSQTNLSQNNIPMNLSSNNSIASNQPKSTQQIVGPSKLYVVDLPTIQPTINPILPNNHPKDLTFKAKFPQIRKSIFSIAIEQNMTYLKLSQILVKSFGLPNNFKAIVYTFEGQAMLFNLDLMNLPLPKLDLDQQFIVMFTTTSSVVDYPPVLGMHSLINPVSISISFGAKKFPISIDLENTLSVLKYFIFEKTGIHPALQILKFANNNLVNDLEILKTYGIQNNSILELVFKNSANLMPSTYADKFYYKDIQHIHTQEPQSLKSLRTNLLVLNRHLSVEDKLKAVSFIREYTGNNALAFAFMTLFDNAFMSQAHRIALEQGLYTAMSDYVKTFDSLPKQLETKDLFSVFRAFIGFVLEAISKVKSDEVELKNRQKYVKVEVNCYFNLKPIKNPAELVLDNGETVIVDKILMEQQINKGFVYQTIKAPKVSMLKVTPQLLNAFEIINNNSIDYNNINVILWKGALQKPYFIACPSTKCSYDFYVTKVDNYPQLKVHKPLEIKNKTSYYLILKNKQNQLKVYVSKNKDINKPYNIYDVMTGQQQAVNLDIMMGAAKTQNLQQVVDLKQIKPVITRQPKEAIAVLFDISGSMGGKFFNETDLNRIGAVKSFFQAFAYRTIAYNFQHVVSLIFFDNVTQIQCDFTQAIYDFNRFVAGAQPRGGTNLYDSINTAVIKLKQFKARYPDCLLRILALTDGQDTGSLVSIPIVTEKIIKAQIVMDSFAVGTNCVGLKNITIATGGKCYLTRNLQQSLKLFQQETVLSIRSRKIQLKNQLSVEQRLEIAATKPFDLCDSVYEFKMPEVQKPGTSAKDMAKMLQGEQSQKKLGGSNSLKRIAKQIQAYQKNPHPFVSIYPCSDINLWKILLLGPKETPYENGLFLLYAQFPGDYPFRPPVVRFITPIYHCNMNSQGRICHSVFDRNYSPAISFRQIVDCVYGLILTPEPQDPLDNVIASYFLSDYPTYLNNAKQSTKEKASKTVQQIVEQLFGKIADDIERQKKVEEIGTWIKTAKSFN